MISAEEFLGIVKPIDKTENFKLGKIDSNYTTGRPKIMFDGEAIISEKRYCYLSSYTPVANNRVLLIKISGTFVILGKII
jgi:hypothetical protein